MMKAGEKVERLLAQRGMSAAALARLAGVGQDVISRLRHLDGYEPLASKAVRIARALGVPAEWLFDDEADWPPPEQPEADPRLRKIRDNLPPSITAEEVIEAVGLYMAEKARRERERREFEAGRDVIRAADERARRQRQKQKRQNSG